MHLCLLRTCVLPYVPKRLEEIQELHELEFTAVRDGARLKTAELFPASQWVVVNADLVAIGVGDGRSGTKGQNRKP